MARTNQIGPAGSTTCNNWSPDGSKVLCNLWGQDDVQPATANPDGSDFTLLNPNLPLDLFCLSWSPDGARLLCHSEGMANRTDAASTRCGPPTRATSAGHRPTSQGLRYRLRLLFRRSPVLFARHHHPVLAEPDGRGSRNSGLSVMDLDFFDRVGADWSPNESGVTSPGSGGPPLEDSRPGSSSSTPTGPGLPSGHAAASVPSPPSGHQMASGSGSPELERISKALDRASRRNGPSGRSPSSGSTGSIGGRSRSSKRKLLRQCKEKSSDDEAVQEEGQAAGRRRRWPVRASGGGRQCGRPTARSSCSSGSLTTAPPQVELWTVNADGSGAVEADAHA